MKKNRLLTFFSLSLVIGGIVLLLLPQITSHIIQQRTAENAEQTEEIAAEDLQNNLTAKADFDFDRISEISPSETFLGEEQVDDGLIVGRLFIPSIDLNLAVYNGVSDSILHAGVGTMRPNLEMGEGNFPIAGHYSQNKKALFGDLFSIENNDRAYLTDNESVYEYKIYDTKIVEETEVEWIEDQVANEHGEPVLSLMNCYYVNGRDTGKRYFVFGELVVVHDAAKENIAD